MMTHTIFTSTGCVRCKITKSYMQANGIDYAEFDIQGEGKEAFAQFYRENRAAIFRDKDGVEFPVFTDGTTIRQGVSVVIGYLKAGSALDGFIRRSALHGEWIDGFSVSGGDPQQADNFIDVLAYLRQNGLKIQLTSTGANPDVLERVHAGGLGQRLIVEVKGPAGLYAQLAGRPIHTDDITRTLALATRFPEFSFFTTIAPVPRSDGQVSYLTPEEVADAARWIETATGSKKHPYLLKPWKPSGAMDDELQSIAPLQTTEMFKYRTAARRYMVMAEIEKPA